MHPHLIEFVKRISKVSKTYFYTNGLLLTREVAENLKKAGLSFLYVSLHKPEVEQNAIKVTKGLNILKGIIRGVDTYGHNFAGKVNRGVNSMKGRICSFIYLQRGVIRWNGDFTACCIDSTKSNILGNVWDDKAEDIQIKPFELCKSCHSKSNNFTFLDKANSLKNDIIRNAVESISSKRYR